MKRLLITLTSLLAIAALAAIVHAGDAPAAAGDAIDGITVQGTASVSAVPDRAQLWFGVESQGATAKAALAANGIEMRKVIAALRAAGATDLKTQSVNLNPRYGDAAAGGGSVQGFTASNSVSATLAKVGRAGSVIDAAVAAGANQVSGPSLSNANPGELYRQALRAAVGEARTSAQALAAASGLTLGRITAVVEAGSAPTPLYAAASKEADEAGSTPIEPGQQEVSASVTVTFSAS
ncbi:MAG: SIMPL domain-containing protein [Actinobacteria bacterium]|nr:SIMPL domain-containing protein [Actinomycetota bacterium]